jgi:membrane fusion protein (multidrug efflux system)
MEDGDGKLRPGMFVDVAVVLPRKQTFVTVPSTAIVHASYGDSVFIVEDKKPDAPGARQTPDGKPIKVVRQQFVRIGKRRGDFVAVVEGLEADREVVTAGAFKLRNGSPVFVSDAPVPRPELAPRPENR